MGIQTVSNLAFFSEEESGSVSFFLRFFLEMYKFVL